MKKLLLLTPLICFGFTSKYLPHYDINTSCGYILHKKAFDICYSIKYNTPKLVVYKVTKQMLLHTNYKRPTHFKADKELPKKYQISSNWYKYSNYDRGHLAPNSIFNYNKQIQQETFLTTNIAPQTKKLNRYVWSKIEKYEQQEAIKYRDIRVVTGVCKTIGKIKNKINIPKYWYKIIFYKNGKTTSFLAPNSNILNLNINNYKTTLTKIQQKCDILFTPHCF